MESCEKRSKHNGLSLVSVAEWKDKYTESVNCAGICIEMLLAAVETLKVQGCHLSIDGAPDNENAIFVMDFIIADEAACNAPIC